MAPTWNLQDQLSWIKSARPYVPKNMDGIPNLTTQQRQEYDRQVSMSSSMSHRNTTSMNTTINNKNRNFSTETPAVETQSNHLKRSLTVPINTTNNTTTNQTQNSSANISQRNVSGKQINQMNNTEKRSTDSNNTSLQSNTSASSISMKNTSTQSRTQIPITDLLKMSKKRTLDDSNSFIDLTQDETAKETPKEIPPMRKSHLKHDHRRKIVSEEEDSFSDDSDVEAELAIKFSSVVERNSLTEKQNTDSTLIVGDTTKININKTKPPQLFNTKNSLDTSNQGIIFDLCRKQAKLINTLNALISLLDQRIDVEISESLSEIQKRDLRLSLTPDTRIKKAQVAALMDMIPLVDIDALEAEVKSQKSVDKTLELTTQNQIIPNTTSITQTNIPIIDYAPEQPHINVLTDDDLDMNIPNNKDEMRDNLAEDDDDDDDDIIIHNANTTVSKKPDYNVSVLSSPLLSASTDINDYGKSKRIIIPPKPFVLDNSIIDDVEDSFNCDSDEEAETGTQIRKEMGDFVLQDEDSDNDNVSYKEFSQSSGISQSNNLPHDDGFRSPATFRNPNNYNTNPQNDFNELDELESIDQSELNKLQTTDEEIEEEESVGLKPTQFEEILDSDNEMEMDFPNESDIIETSRHETQLRRTQTAIISEDEFSDDDLFDESIMIPNAPDEYTQMNKEREIIEVSSDLDSDEDLDNYSPPSLDVQVKHESDAKSKIHNEPNEIYHEILDSSQNGDDEPHYPWTKDVYNALRDVFKLNSFRSNQLKAINASLDGKDVFVLMPTGGGKSLCYQLPAIIDSGKTSGTTIVISPLISLMEDQVAHLEAKGVHAGMLNSRMNAEEKKHMFDLFFGGYQDLIYLSPEMISNSGKCRSAISSLYRKGKLARIVIDEAHCMSSWGHDFRPDYKKLSFFKQEYPDIPIIALTATANELVQSDIKSQLGMIDPLFLQQSFNRTNLLYKVLPKDKSSVERIVELINSKYRNKTGIIYCHSKNSCETTSDRLRSFNIKCAFYHAGMSAEDRSNVQKGWQSGEIKVIAATIAFGMGIDKADVRYVVHLTIPRNVEGYYQETGRAGRDGNNSECIMFYSLRDARTLQSLIKRDRDLDRESKDHHQEKLQQIIQYCENKTECRRQLVLQFFNESFDRKDCNKMCDNCISYANIEVEHRDVTDLAKQCVKLVKTIEKKKVPFSVFIDIIKGFKHIKITTPGYDKLEYHGSGSDYSKTEIERVYTKLLTLGYLEERAIFGKGKYGNNYMFVTRKADTLINGRVNFTLDFFKPKNTADNNQQPAPLTKQTSFRPISEMYNTSQRPTSRNSSGSNTLNKGVNVSVLSIKDGDKKAHLDECYIKLRERRKYLATTKNFSKETTLASDTMLKNMALILPINEITYSKLDDYKSSQGEYFKMFRPTIEPLRKQRMAKFHTLDLENSRPILLPESNGATSNKRSRFFSDDGSVPAKRAKNSQSSRGRSQSQSQRGKGRKGRTNSSSHHSSTGKSQPRAKPAYTAAMRS